MNNNPLKVVVIGGGHGQSVILRGIKFIQDIQISAIVTVADGCGVSFISPRWAISARC